MNYVVQDTSLIAVADAIRKQTKSTEQILFPNGFVSEIEKIDAESSYNNGYQQGYTEGEEQGYSRGYKQGKAEGSDFTRYIKDLGRMFYDATFPEGYELDLIVDGAGDMTQFMWLATGVKSVKLAFVNKGATVAANYAFSDPSDPTRDVLETVDISNAECKFFSFAGVFGSRKVLKHIIGEIDLSVSGTNSGAFYNCLALEDVSFKPLSIGMTISFGNSPLLSAASVQSIINGLADLTGASTQTLTLHTTVKAKLTEAQIAAITSKNWTLA